MFCKEEPLAWWGTERYLRESLRERERGVDVVGFEGGVNINGGGGGGGGGDVWRRWKLKKSYVNGGYAFLSILRANMCDVGDVSPRHPSHPTFATHVPSPSHSLMDTSHLLSFSSFYPSVFLP